jgi:UDP-N-acetylglucosamine 2-epimerase (non-hydrolysing)
VTLHVAVVLGTRPEVVKNYSTVRALRGAGARVTVLHTNQHHDLTMHGAVFEQLRYRPDRIAPGPYRVGAAVDWICAQVLELGVTHVLVNGDTAAALEGAVAALYSDVQLSHVEAGLRAGDEEMVEERNRIMVDSAAHHLFCYTEAAGRRLRSTPYLRGRVHVVGNTTLDVLQDFERDIPMGPPAPYVFVTLHRKELIERPQRLRGVLQALEGIAEHVGPVIFPVHPRTRPALRQLGFPAGPGITLLEPVPPLASLGLIRGASLVVTDSGCVQEEACILQVPCVTVRGNTERPETVEVGANVVAGYDPAVICAAAARQIGRTGDYPPVYGTPGAGARIAAVLTRAQRDTDATEPSEPVRKP